MWKGQQMNGNVLKCPTIVIGRISQNMSLFCQNNMTPIFRTTDIIFMTIQFLVDHYSVNNTYDKNGLKIYLKCKYKTHYYLF